MVLPQNQQSRTIEKNQRASSEVGSDAPRRIPTKLFENHSDHMITPTTCSTSVREGYARVYERAVESHHPSKYDSQL